ncbi:unnamed protein product [Polarella glacialis]|uniref:Uncharacterized protein n=1 Tax=Polarella glacialis TaxID=89957 RepID=A0A813EQT7_POLGL|nr:unnamed protein product [Polarella glacialis]
MKPDVYYLARPKELKNERFAQDQWHRQEGRQEVIDYIFYDPGLLELEAAAKLPRLDLDMQDMSGGPAKRARLGPGADKGLYGYWAGGWALSPGGLVAPRDSCSRLPRQPVSP